MKNFESTFSSNIEKSKGQENKSEGFEVMKTPEIVTQAEQGAQLFSVLLKAENPNWGETETPIAKEVTEYFKENPLTSEIREGIQKLHEEDADEESLYNLALAYNHPERLDIVFEMIEKYKPHIENPQETQQRFFNILKTFDESFSSSFLAKKIYAEVEQDKNKRSGNLEETKGMIKELIDFFKPDSTTTHTKKINFIPTDPLYGEKSGRSFRFGDEQVIISYIKNTENQEHEFLHSVINPIVDKLSEKLTAEQKKNISKLTSEKPRRDYGEKHYSLLCEELIRTYNIFKKGEGVLTYEKFAEKISHITDSEFQKEIKSRKELKQKLDEMNIKNTDDLKSKSREYYDKYEQSELTNIIHHLYQAYSNRPNKNDNFEHFILEKFSILTATE